jgi:hypothetical protein
MEKQGNNNAGRILMSRKKFTFIIFLLLIITKDYLYGAELAARDHLMSQKMALWVSKKRRPMD